MLPVYLCNKVTECLGIGNQQSTDDAAELVRTYVAVADVVGWNWLGERGTIASLVAATVLASGAADVETLLFEKFVPEDIEHAQLALNVASVHARAARKPEMCAAIRRAMLLGKEPDDFMNDDDFKAFHADADFLAALKG